MQLPVLRVRITNKKLIRLILKIKSLTHLVIPGLTRNPANPPCHSGLDPESSNRLKKVIKLIKSSGIELKLLDSGSRVALARNDKVIILVNPRIIAAGVLTVIVIGVVFKITATPTKAAWFNDGWTYRKAVTVTNGTGGTLTSYQVSFTLDTKTLITAKKIQSSCQDIRVADSTGASLPYWIEESGTGACNLSTTRIWTILASIPTTGATLYVYYGNPNAIDLSSPSSIFSLYDTFSGSSVNGTNWTTGGSPVVASGALALTNGATLSSNSTQTTSGLGRLIFAVKQAATNLTGGKIGFSNTASLASNFHADQAAAFIAGSTTEQIKQTGGASLMGQWGLDETNSTQANQFKASGYLDTGKLGQAVSVYGNAAGTAGSTLTFNSGAQISSNNYEHFNSNQGTVSFWVKPNWNGND
ncbi:MAG: DUF2341 domain-containing protein, partial [candidate division WWE3 bacterium]|nr:DUF2341 domain-containing protein [candidate division WWE3 bacterium]